MFDAMVDGLALKSAEKVDIADWNGPALWSDDAGRSFDSYDSLTDWYAERNRMPPEYVWECVRGTMDPGAAALEVVDVITKDQAPVETRETDRLHAYLRSWIRANDIRMSGWIKGNKRVVVLRAR
jgi:hypothetical protein